MSKQVFREKVLKQLRNQKRDIRRDKSLQIEKKLLSMSEFKDAKTILFYASFDGEVETFAMIEKALRLGKEIALPDIDEKNREIYPVQITSLQDLSKGSYGILEPNYLTGHRVNKEDLDMIIVPGVCFDKYNNRIGRGVGYYDRFLKNILPHIPTVGLAFDFQITHQNFSAEDHDIKVSHVVHN